MIAPTADIAGALAVTKLAAIKESPIVAMRTPPQKENPSMACLRQPAAPPENPATVDLLAVPV